MKDCYNCENCVYTSDNKLICLIQEKMVEVLNKNYKPTKNFKICKGIDWVNYDFTGKE